MPHSFVEREIFCVILEQQEVGHLIRLLYFRHKPPADRISSIFRICFSFLDHVATHLQRTPDRLFYSTVIQKDTKKVKFIEKKTTRPQCQRHASNSDTETEQWRMCFEIRSTSLKYKVLI